MRTYCSCEQVSELEEKGRRYDAAAARAETAEQALAAARSLSESQAAALADLTDSNATVQRMLSESEQRRALLELDKAHLQRELSAAEVRGESAGRLAEERRVKVRRQAPALYSVAYTVQ